MYLTIFYQIVCLFLFPLTHTPYITAVEAGRSSRRDEGPGLDLGGVFYGKRTPPFLGGFLPQKGV